MPLPKFATPLVPVTFALLIAAPIVVPSEARGAEPAADREASSDEAPGELHASLAPLEPLLGDWEIESTWTGGQTLWSRCKYRPTLDGRFIAAETWVRDGDGPVYLRYRSMMGAGEEPNTFTAHSFAFEGTVQKVDYRLTEEGDLATVWSVGESEFKEHLTLGEPESHWRVWARPKGQGDDAWNLVMDGTWRKQEAGPDVDAGTKPARELARTRPID